MSLTITPVRQTRTAESSVMPVTPVPPVDAIEQRVRHLFRRLSRAGLVHPLQHLVLRYRAGEL